MIIDDEKIYRLMLHFTLLAILRNAGHDFASVYNGIYEYIKIKILSRLYYCLAKLLIKHDDFQWRILFRPRCWQLDWVATERYTQYVIDGRVEHAIMLSRAMKDASEMGRLRRMSDEEHYVLLDDDIIAFNALYQQVLIRNNNGRIPPTIALATERFDTYISDGMMRFRAARVYILMMLFIRF